MNTKLYALLLLCLTLAACSLNSPLPKDEVVTPTPAPTIQVVTPPPAPPDEIGPLLSYHQTLRRMTQGELMKELSGLGQQTRSPRVAIQMGMALMLTRGGGDLARAQTLLDSVATSAELEASPYRALAQLLSSNCAEARRLYEHADRLATQQKDNQRRIDQLNDMLEGLKAIERTLPARPAPAAQVTK